MKKIKVWVRVKYLSVLLYGFSLFSKVSFFKIYLRLIFICYIEWIRKNKFDECVLLVGVYGGYELFKNSLHSSWQGPSLRPQKQQLHSHQRLNAFAPIQEEFKWTFIAWVTKLSNKRAVDKYHKDGLINLFLTKIFNILFNCTRS